MLAFDAKIMISSSYTLYLPFSLLLDSTVPRTPPPILRLDYGSPGWLVSNYYIVTGHMQRRVRLLFTVLHQSISIVFPAGKYAKISRQAGAAEKRRLCIPRVL
jgi:hypothetical protein